MPKLEGKYCPFYEWDENVCNPGKGHPENPTGKVGAVSRQPHCRGEKDWKICDIYQNTCNFQEMMSKMAGTEFKPKW